MRRLLALLVAIGFGSTCTAHRVLRPVAEPIDTSVNLIQQDRAHRQSVAARSLELHKGSGADFDLAVVEFDDQGWLWNPAQLTLAINRTYDVAKDDGALIVAFFHGWKNNADVCNANVVCFRDALGLLAKRERALAEKLGVAPRRVIGIYPAWRGLSLKVGRNLSFWGRKETAHRVGRAGVVELVAELDALHRSLVASKPETRLVFIGHSFGAALLYEATTSIIRTSLVGAMRRPVPSGCEPAREEVQPVSGVGDLMVLVNPAFEASLYHDVDVRSHWFDRYSRLQTPVLMTVSSQADYATRLAFPVGRWLSTAAQRTRGRDQRKALEQTIGNYSPFMTHTLELTPRAASRPAPRPLLGDCQCPVNFGAMEFELPPTGVTACNLHLADTREFGNVILKKDPDLNPDNPFNVVTADKAIITSHSGIFTEPFFDFLVRFVGLIDLKKRSPRTTQ